MSDTDSDAEFEELTRQLTAAQRRERDANAQVCRSAVCGVSPAHCDSTNPHVVT